MKYELEHSKRRGADHLGVTDEEIKTVAGSNNIQELRQIASTIKLKGNQHYCEELRIIELDEYGDIINYVWESPEIHKVGDKEETK